MRVRKLAAAAALLVAAPAVLPGCACGMWRPDNQRSLAMARAAFVGRTVDDWEATKANVAGVPGWFERDFRNSSRNLRSTYELYTDCPEADTHPSH